MNKTEQLLFTKVLEEKNTYMDLSPEEKYHGIGTVRVERFKALWDLIEEAGLVNKYEAWIREGKEEEEYFSIHAIDDVHDVYRGFREGGYTPEDIELMADILRSTAEIDNLSR